MVRTLSIRHREYLTLAVVGVLLAGTAAVTFWQVGAIDRTAREVDRGSRASAALAQFAVEMSAIVRHEPNGERWSASFDRLLASLDTVEGVTGEQAAAPVRSALKNYEREYFALQSRATQATVPPIEATVGPR